jgi:hypothetical protein
MQVTKEFTTLFKKEIVLIILLALGMHATG